MRSVPIVLLGLLVALLSSGGRATAQSTRPRAHRCDRDVCVFLSVAPSDPAALTVVIEGPPDAKWLGIGFSTSMASGDSYIGMMSATNTPIVSRRRLVGRRSPETLPQADQHAVPPQGNSFGKVDAVNKFVVQFTRPRTGVDLARPVNVIYAYSNRPVPNPGPAAAIPKHEEYGRLTLDLNDEAQRTAYDTALQRNRDMVQKAKNGGAATTTPGSGDGGQVKADAEQGKGALIPAAPGGSGPAAGSGVKVGVSVESQVIMG
ncbi:hypothetical protein BCR44DRAFT_1439034 [Catenaria anguillulae PL171]|uniref:DOMON domain-containing protein n=1 Tax=Catenaria anguillulae PL171 TaxID=765915 RepID=A0A1Y2HGD5_9FUNG|nr:hypothetical protein BCR44DRAFT_1439034 [Catenaria anguillulae PL171]